MTAAAHTLATRFLTSLAIPEGPMAGQPLKLAPFQKAFLRGALAPGVRIGCLSVGRGNGKTALCAGVALGSLLGELGDDQPRREVLVAAINREQGGLTHRYVEGLSRSLPEDVQKRLKFKKSPVLSITLDDEHEIRVLPADGKSALGTSPTLIIMDERGHWPLDKGNALEHALLTGRGKRDGRALIISTSAADDAHPFSRWLDEPQDGVFVQEHRPPLGLPADDRESLLIANPGAKAGIGANLKILEKEAERAIKQGGATLASFRLYNRNERVSADSRDVLLTTDEWLECETGDLPPRDGACVVGIDLGASASMTGAAFYWPSTGRLEALGWFPSRPSLLDRGQRDGVSSRYVEMRDRSELDTLGDQTVPVAPWLSAVMRHVDGATVSALVADRFKQAELSEAMQRAGVRAPIVWRGMGFRDGGEDVERFRRAAFDGEVLSAPSLLMRSAMADAIVVRDDAANAKLAKGRARGRIDPVSAAVLAVAEGARQNARTTRPARKAVWI